LKEAVLKAALDAGFVRARILAPWMPPAGAAANYREGAPALLMAALAYGNRAPGAVSGAPPGTAEIAPFAQRNYYRETVKRLQRLSGEFRQRFGGQKRDFRILCNSPVPEKPPAAACGLGALGRNGLIICPEAGSLVVIAAMTLPWALSGDGPLEGSPCAACNPQNPPCAAACPTGALAVDGSFHREWCIQWYASGYGETVPPEVAAQWGRRFYGCNLCQDACIWHQKPIPGAETAEGILPAWIDCRELLALSDEAIRARFRGTALGLSWLSPQALRRNAEMAL
jgi:epoxyqueuosine reductase